METFQIIVLLFIFVVIPAVFILLFWVAYKMYYKVNEKSDKEFKKVMKVRKSGKYPLFYLKSRGWGLSIFNAPFGASVGGSQQTASVELKEKTIVFVWLKRMEVPYSKLKKVDAFDFALNKWLVFHFKGSPFTKYGNIVNKSLMVNVLKVLKSKGVKLSKKAENMIK